MMAYVIMIVIFVVTVALWQLITGLSARMTLGFLTKDEKEMFNHSKKGKRND